MADVVTIREAVRRAEAEGMPVSEYTLRCWIKSGAIPVRTVGKKNLLYYPNLVKYLQCDFAEKEFLLTDYESYGGARKRGSVNACIKR